MTNKKKEEFQSINIYWCTNTITISIQRLLHGIACEYIQHGSKQMLDWYIWNPFFFLTTSAALPILIYDISVELNISDAVVLNQLRALLSNMTHPITINDYVQISDINITTGKNECIIAVVLLV